MSRPPVPIPDADSRPWWEALREHRLLFQHCWACGHQQLYYRAMCRRCWSRDLSGQEASGRGTVHSYTVMRRVGDPVLAEEVPYVVALVDLEEGPRVLARLDAPVDEVEIGAPVVASFHAVDDEVTLLHFTPVG